MQGRVKMTLPRAAQVEGEVTEVEALVDGELDFPEARLGLGRIVALHHRSSTSHQIRDHMRSLCF
jgi:hypothetical protein